MFFKKLFSRKGYKDYESLGDSLLAQNRFADARIEYETAIDKLGSEANASDSDAFSRISSKFVQTGNELAKLNLEEAKTAFSSGNSERGEEFLELAESFSSLPEIRREITEIIKSAKSQSSISLKYSTKAGKDQDDNTSVKPADYAVNPEPHPDDDIRFELYASTLPSDLPERYRSCGEDFAKACVLSHNGSISDALKLFRKIDEHNKTDICCYEMAIITAQMGNATETESLLNKSLEINPNNPLACLSLVQLYMAQKRFNDSQLILERMLNDGILGNQTLILLGDNASALGNMKEAEAFYLRALQDKSLASVAAERLVPIMESTGRIKEKEFLVKKHCGKGCC